MISVQHPTVAVLLAFYLLSSVTWHCVGNTRTTCNAFSVVSVLPNKHSFVSNRYTKLNALSGVIPRKKENHPSVVRQRLRQKRAAYEAKEAKLVGIDPLDSLHVGYEQDRGWGYDDDSTDGGSSSVIDVDVRISASKDVMVPVSTNNDRVLRRLDGQASWDQTFGKADDEATPAEVRSELAVVKSKSKVVDVQAKVEVKKDKSQVAKVQVKKQKRNYPTLTLSEEFSALSPNHPAVIREKQKIARLQYLRELEGEDEDDDLSEVADVHVPDIEEVAVATVDNAIEPMNEAVEPSLTQEEIEAGRVLDKMMKEMRLMTAEMRALQWTAINNGSEIGQLKQRIKALSVRATAAKRRVADDVQELDIDTDASINELRQTMISVKSLEEIMRHLESEADVIRQRIMVRSETFQAAKERAEVSFEDSVDIDEVIAEGSKYQTTIASVGGSPESNFSGSNGTIEVTSEAVRKLRNECAEKISAISEIKARIHSLSERASHLKDRTGASVVKKNLKEYIQTDDSPRQKPEWR